MDPPIHAHSGQKRCDDFGETSLSKASVGKCLYEKCFCEGQFSVQESRVCMSPYCEGQLVLWWPLK